MTDFGAQLFAFGASLVKAQQTQDQAERSGPRPCCSEFAGVTFCENGTEFWTCPLCSRSWSAPCPPVTEEGR